MNDSMPNICCFDYFDRLIWGGRSFVRIEMKANPAVRTLATAKSTTIFSWTSQ